MALLVALIASLSACEGTDGEQVSELRGRPIGALQEEREDDSTVAIQDLSAIVGREPSFTASEIQSDRWIIIAACADDESIRQADDIQVGVVPKDALDNEIVKRAQQGEFDSLIGC